jgi:hypothetical protein
MMKWTGTIKAEHFIEAICACHLASYVRGPVKDRGGLMLVGPPGALKTTFLDALENYHNTVTASNLNTQTLTKMHQDMSNGAIRSLIIPDMHAIYAGDPRTAQRLEAMLMQLAGEGTRGPSWQDSRYQKFVARCTVFGAMTNKHFERKTQDWEESGFLRRFLWVSYALDDPDVLMRALEQWKRADIGAIAIPTLPADKSIEDSLTVDERRVIRTWLKYQPAPHEIQYSLLCRATSALRWCYKTYRIKKEAMHTMHCFAEALQKDASHVKL